MTLVFVPTWHLHRLHLPSRYCRISRDCLRWSCHTGLHLQPKAWILHKSSHGSFSSLIYGVLIKYTVAYKGFRHILKILFLFLCLHIANHSLINKVLNKYTLSRINHIATIIWEELNTLFQLYVQQFVCVVFVEFFCYSVTTVHLTLCYRRLRFSATKSIQAFIFW